MASKPDWFKLSQLRLVSDKRPSPFRQQSFRQGPIRYSSLQRDAQQRRDGIAIRGKLGQPFDQPARHHQNASPSKVQVDPFKPGRDARFYRQRQDPSPTFEYLLCFSYGRQQSFNNNNQFIGCAYQPRKRARPCDYIELGTSGFSAVLQRYQALIEAL